MMKFTIIFILLIGTTCAFKFNLFGIFGHDHDSSEEKHGAGPTGEGFPFPTFLINSNLSHAVLQAWFEIGRNESATKADVKAAQDAWASQQNNSEIQALYTEWKQNVTAFFEELIASGDSTVSNASDAVKSLYKKVKAVRLNDSLTRREECKQIRSIFDGADRKDVKKLLKTVPGVQGNCFGPPRIGGHGRGHGDHEGSGSDSNESNERPTDNSTDLPPPSATTQSSNFFKRLFGF